MIQGFGSGKRDTVLVNEEGPVSSHMVIENQIYYICICIYLKKKFSQLKDFKCKTKMFFEVR